ncbi:MAG TPA: 50S ribosomal protein L33 [Tenericutes bacterium]|jgi:large subunit ribosomal protein L33|nr:50S ribosomal protein L33 [Mycoplasmatota bacterium]
MREYVILRCTECKEENYHTQKNPKNNPDRLEISKYCSKCNKKTIHREKK